MTPTINTKTLQTESSLVASILYGDLTIGEVVELGITPKEFFNSLIAEIYTMMVKMHSESKAVVADTVHDAIVLTGREDLLKELETLKTANVVSEEELSGIVRCMKDTAMKIAINAKTASIVKKANDGNVEEALNDLSNLADSAKTYADDDEFPSEADFAEKEYMEIFNAERHAVRKTNFPYLDDLLGGGLHPGIYAIAGTSGLGKTAICGNLTDKLTEQGYHTLYFAYEQTGMDTFTKSLSRMIAKRFGRTISYVKIRYNWHPGMDPKEALTEGCSLTPDDVKLINGAYDYMKPFTSKYKHTVNAKFGLTVDDVVTKIKKFIKKFGEKPVVFVDYLQLITMPKDYKGTDMNYLDECVKKLKQLSVDEKLTIFVISSVNRSSYTTKLSMESLKGSGGIEYSCDAVLALDLTASAELKEKGDKAEAHELIERERNATVRRITLTALKNRFGMSGETYFAFTPAQDYFQNLEKPMPMPAPKEN